MVLLLQLKLVLLMVVLKLLVLMVVMLMVVINNPILKTDDAYRKDVDDEGVPEDILCLCLWLYPCSCRLYW